MRRMPKDHALLSASAAHRWLNCTAAPRYEMQFPQSSSVYAEEGTLAHSICETLALYRFKKITLAELNHRLGDLTSRELYSPEMLETAQTYADFLEARAEEFGHEPYLAFEQRVDLGNWIPEGFGTCDSIMICGDTLRITDYKHGKGVPVSAEGNPQMRLYALGALAQYMPVYGDAIKHVVMAIVQPRLSAEPSEDEMSVEELLAWGLKVKPIARVAYDGPGTFSPGEHCRFCRGKAQCRARAQYYAGLSTDLPPAITDDEVGELLKKAEGLVAWYDDLKEYAQGAILEGKAIRGWKVVEGRSIRSFSDADKAAEVLIECGIDKAVLFDLKMKSLSEIEKMLGKKHFAEICGDYVVKPQGKPTLAPDTDKRPAFNPGAAEFGGLTKDQASIVLRNSEV